MSEIGLPEIFGNYSLPDTVCINNDYTLRVCTDEEIDDNAKMKKFIDAAVESKEKFDFEGDKDSANKIRDFLQKFYFRPNVNHVSFTGIKEIPRATINSFSDDIKADAKAILDKYEITNLKSSKSYTKSSSQKTSKSAKKSAKKYTHNKIGCHAPGIRSIMRMSDKHVNNLLRSIKFKF